MGNAKNAYTEIPAGSSYPNYSDYRVATELGFKLTYTSSASGKLFGAVLHLPSNWTAKMDLGSELMVSKSYSVYDEHNYKRGYIVYNYCDVDKDSHIIKKEAFLDVTLYSRFGIYVSSYQFLYSRLTLIDQRENVVYNTTHYYPTFEACQKKCENQRILLEKCLPNLNDTMAYWNSDSDVLVNFFKLSNYVWEKAPIEN